LEIFHVLDSTRAERTAKSAKEEAAQPIGDDGIFGFVESTGKRTVRKSRFIAATSFRVGTR
jgi:hypothetical protein